MPSTRPGNTNTGTARNGRDNSAASGSSGSAGIEIDRKVLSDLAVNDAAAFSAIVAQAKQALAAKAA